MFLLGLLIVQLRVGNLSLMLQLGHLLIGLVCLILPVMTVMTGSGFRKDFGLVGSFHGRVLLLGFVDFAVNDGSKGVSNLVYRFFRLELELTRLLGRLDRILKVKTGFAFAGFLIKDALLLENLFGGKAFAGSVQPLMRLFRLLFETLDCLSGSRSIRDWLFSGSLGSLVQNALPVYGLNNFGFADAACDGSCRNHTARNNRIGIVSLRGKGHGRRAFADRQLTGLVFFRLWLFLFGSIRLSLIFGFVLRSQRHLCLRLRLHIIRASLGTLLRFFRGCRSFGFMRLHELGVFRSLCDFLGCTFRQVFPHSTIPRHSHNNLVLGLQLLLCHQISPPIRALASSAYSGFSSMPI